MIELNCYEGRMSVLTRGYYATHQAVYKALLTPSKYREFIFDVQPVQSQSLVLVTVRAKEQLHKNLTAKKYTIDEGQVIKFRLQTVAVQRESGANGRKERGPVFGQQARDWLAQKGPYQGFDITHMDEPQHEWRYIKFKGGKPIPNNATLFTGSLIVTHPETFADTMINGIGRRKSFGFGLIQVGENNVH